MEFPPGLGCRPNPVVVIVVERAHGGGSRLTTPEHPVRRIWYQPVCHGLVGWTRMRSGCGRRRVVGDDLVDTGDVEGGIIAGRRSLGAGNK